MLAQRLRDGQDGRRDPADRRRSQPSRLIEGCDRAAIGVLDGDTVPAAAATDDVMRLIDELQNEVGEGPCLEASTDDIAQIDNDITQHSPVAAAGRHRRRADAGAGDARRPAASTRATRSGALNVFSGPTDAFDDESLGDRGDPGGVRVGRVWRARVSPSGPTSSQEGMATNREIGAAVGHPDGDPQHQPGRGLRPAEQGLAAAQPQAARHRHRHRPRRRDAR